MVNNGNVNSSVKAESSTIWCFAVFKLKEQAISIFFINRNIKNLVKLEISCNFPDFDSHM